MTGNGPDGSTLGLDPDLLEILACPAPDHGALVVGTPDDPAASALTCTVCHRRYPVSDGIPVLLLSEAVGGSESSGDGSGSAPSSAG